MKLCSEMELVRRHFKDFHSPIGITLSRELRTLRDELRNIRGIDLVPMSVSLPNYLLPVERKRLAGLIYSNLVSPQPHRAPLLYDSVLLSHQIDDRALCFGI